MSTWEEQAERDAAQQALRDEWAQNFANRSEHYTEWAAWARERLAAASPAAARVIAQGLPAEVKSWQLQEMAARQAGDFRRERGPLLG